jgi:hypothetical protein
MLPDAPRDGEPFWTAPRRAATMAAGMHGSPPTERHLELAATVLLALGTLLTAWAAYQARQWTGVQAVTTSRATATRLTENRAAALANRQVQIDVATFVQWLDARQRHDRGLAAFYRERFRAEFQPAFASWIATRPFTDKAAPPTPFAMPQYRLRATAQAATLERTAAAASNDAKDANQRADNDMLAVVLLAAALFFAGISLKLQSRDLRLVLLVLSAVVFLGALAWMVTIPVRLKT